MGRHPLGSLRRIDRRALQAGVRELMDRLGVRLDPEQPVRGLSIADQQIVEIAKSLSFDARVLIMDEPTAALSGHEVERLFGVVRALRERGAAVLFISHRLEEIFTICDTVTVLRDGEVTHDGEVAGLTTDELVRRMVGRELSQLFPKQDAEIGAPVLKVERLTREGVFTDVSFTVRQGEIVGAGRARGRGPQRGGPGHLRHRQARRRPGRGRRRQAQAGLARAGHAGRRRPRPRGPPSAGPRDGPVDRAQCRPDAAGRAERRAGHHRPRQGGRARLRLGDQAAAEVPPARRPGGLPVRRQPAEGRAGQVAGHQPEGADHRRAHARHRRRHQGRGAPADVRAGRPGPRRADDLLRAARGAGDGRPRAGHARGPARRRRSPGPTPTRRPWCAAATGQQAAAA